MTPRGHSPLLRRGERCRPLPERAQPCRAARTSGGQTQRVGVVHVIGNGLDIIHQRCIGRTGRRCRRQALQTGVAERWQACRLTRSPVLVSTVTISGQRIRARNAEHVDEKNQRSMPGTFDAVATVGGTGREQRSRPQRIHTRPRRECSGALPRRSFVSGRVGCARRARAVRDVDEPLHRLAPSGTRPCGVESAY